MKNLKRLLREEEFIPVIEIKNVKFNKRFSKYIIDECEFKEFRIKKKKKNGKI